MRKIIRYLYRKAKKVFPPASAPIVLCYHAVSKLSAAYRPFLVIQDNFREHLKILKKYYNPISLNQFQDALLTGRIPTRAALVTFDDNYKEHLDVAMPLLEEMKVPAVMFIGSGFIDSDKEYFWDELGRMLLTSNTLPASIKLEHNGEKTYWQFNDARPAFSLRQKAYGDLLKLLMEMDRKDLEHSMQSLREQIRDDGNIQNACKLLTSKELIELASSQWIEIGSHTCNHLLLAKKSLETQMHEITHDKKNLENLLQRPVTCLAYPYGGPDDVGNNAAELAKNAGFSMAFTTDWQPVRKSFDLFRLPRLMIHNMTGEEFRSAIHFWL